MACRCHTNKTSSEAPALQNGSSSPLKSPDEPVSSELPLPRCFLCAMKHLMRAKSCLKNITPDIRRISNS